MRTIFWYLWPSSPFMVTFDAFDHKGLCNKIVIWPTPPPPRGLWMSPLMMFHAFINIYLYPLFWIPSFRTTQKFQKCCSTLFRPNNLETKMCVTGCCLSVLFLFCDEWYSNFFSVIKLMRCSSCHLDVLNCQYHAFHCRLYY